jgi:hypothetical protein
MQRKPFEAVKRIARLPDVELNDAALEAVVAQSSFDHMKQNADQFAPDAARGLYKNNEQFFSIGGNEQWADALSKEDLDLYDQRLAELVSEVDRQRLTNGPMQ